MAYAFVNRKVYSFDVYPSAVIGTSFKKVTALAILDYNTALGFADIEALHINVYPYLPAGTPNRPQDFDYLLLRTESGDQTVVGIPWIIDDTVELVEALKVQAIIDGVGSADLERIRICLTQNGYNNIDLQLIS
jgi:hypothetical protein